MARERNLKFDVKFEALGAEPLEAKTLMPTALSSRELELLEVSIRENSFFSSKVSDAKLLAEMQDYIARAARGESGFHRENFLARMRSYLGVEEGESKRMDDITSAQRLRLIFDFHIDRIASQKQYFRDQKRKERFPVREFVRIERREEPRNWRERWKKAGGTFYEGRMLAPFDSKIWEKISRFGVPYAPFDFNSGMGTRLISKREALALGVLSEKDLEKTVEKQETPFDDLNGGETQILPKPKKINREKLGENALVSVRNRDSIAKTAKARLRANLGDRIAFSGNDAIFVGKVGENASQAYRNNLILPETVRPKTVSIHQLTVENIAFPQNSTNGKRFLDFVENIFFNVVNVAIDELKIASYIVAKPSAIRYDKQENRFAFGRKFRNRFFWVATEAINTAKKIAIFHLLTK